MAIPSLLLQGPFEFPTTGRLWWTVFVFALWMAVVAGVVYVTVRVLSAHRPVGEKEARGRLAVLRERFRRGKLDRELYRDILEDPGGTAPTRRNEDEEEDHRGDGDRDTDPDRDGDRGMDEPAGEGAVRKEP